LEIEEDRKIDRGGDSISALGKAKQGKAIWQFGRILGLEFSLGIDM
jgi:hypothetical protein